jgi:NhaP-type Na+/H+ or K+/H+ antiporter
MNISKDLILDGEQLLNRTEQAFLHNEHVILSGGMFIFSTLLVTTLLLQYHIASVWKLVYIPEAVVTLSIGMAVSGLIRICGGYSYYRDQDNLSTIGMLDFNSSLFFFVLLPPILFNSGFHLKRFLFFSNIGGILSLALVGTFISSTLVAISLYYLQLYGLIPIQLTVQECIAFGALISSTDPVSTLSAFANLKVDPTLFYLVFGESILNDAVCVTLFRIASNLIGQTLALADIYFVIFNFFVVFILSCIVGYTSGIFSAFIFKHVRNEVYNEVS